MAKDTCIMCGVETPYDLQTHIDVRIGYIEGAGQLCSKCYGGDNNNSYIDVPKHIIYNTPNDAELGEKVRQMYWRSLE
jgi:hypothetical protein